MKIERLIAEAVFGHLNFDLKFNHDITFLAGINGDGKTTALRLIIALLTPSLRELDQIPHHSVELLMQADDKIFIVKSISYYDKLVLSVNTENEPLEYSRLNLSQFEENSRAATRIEEHYSIIEEKFSEHPVIKCLSHLETPTFLGLEKRQPAIYPRMAFIKRFLSLVNRFLSDSDKELQIDAVGWLVVKMKGQPDRTLEALSSGERQIVTILAHLALNEHRSQAGIFIVDEPELSLHLKWQEIFIDALIEASPSTQFILATHAPAIVLEREDKCLTMRT